MTVTFHPTKPKKPTIMKTEKKQLNKGIKTHNKLLKTNHKVKTINKSFLKHGDVTVKVDYSDLNFKDGMILKNGGRLVKEFPHIPGIDFSGTVIESQNSKFKKDDEVILTGFRVGEIFYGGYSQLAKVNAEFLIKKPKKFLFQSRLKKLKKKRKPWQNMDHLIVEQV